MTRQLADFVGDWRFDRTIRHANGDVARVTGQAQFTATETGLTQTETGQMSLNGGTPLTAQQTYHWAAGLSVAFSDGRPFHVIPPAGGPVHHDCSPDQYDGVYDFSAWPRWHLQWNVTGPRKSYVMSTTYTRA